MYATNMQTNGVLLFLLLVQSLIKTIIHQFVWQSSGPKCIAQTFLPTVVCAYFSSFVQVPAFIIIMFAAGYWKVA